jgi:hypothetical protein
MEEDYWRKVYRGASERTWRLLGWSKEKAIGIAVLVIGTVLVGGVASLFNLVSNSITVLAGLAVVAASVFLWGVFETQAEMYHVVSDEKELMSTRVEAPGVRRKRPPANFDKWRHVPKLELQTAAQLWTGEQPGLGMFGEVKETYAMLCGGIQTGQLAFELEDSVDPRMREIVRRAQQENPRPDMKVTREALQAFAKLHGYAPEFLREK